MGDMVMDAATRIAERLGDHEPRIIAADVAPRRAAVAIILGPAPDSRLLLIRRAEQSGDPWSGHMAFPGGVVDPGDASARQAAARETLEEVAVDLAADARYLGRMDDVRASAGGRVVGLAITPFVFALDRPVAPEPSAAEVQEVLWLPLSMLSDPGARSTVSWEHEDRRYELPCIRHRGRVIWGLTFQMLMALVELAGLDGEV